jgi:hypothetical protein
VKRESSASIKSGPAAYEQTEPAKPQKILEFDCRGLEFVEFKAEVCEPFVISGRMLMFDRANGSLRVPRQGPSLRLSSWRKASGSSMMRSPTRKLASTMLSGKFVALKTQCTCACIEHMLPVRS